MQPSFDGKYTIGGEWRLSTCTTNLGPNRGFRGNEVYQLTMYDPKTRSEINIRTNDPTMIQDAPAKPAESAWIKIEDQQPSCEDTPRFGFSDPLEFNSNASRNPLHR